MQLFRHTAVADKVAFLMRPDVYPDRPDSVSAIETHFAWVFLTKNFAYKLKKPVRLPSTDLRTVHARKANCELELALNRRLASDTYIGVVALGRQRSGLRLECDSRPVDWLVKMRRLPHESTLENLLPTIEVGDPRLVQLMETLCAFYARAVRAPWNVDDYAGRLKRQSKHDAKGFKHPDLGAHRARVRRIADLQCLFVDRNLELLAGRIRQRRVRDVHGDLRPEHIFLTDDPQIIDCLEFSSDLRQLDTAEEVSFLALECERLGRTEIANRLRRLYIESSDDDAPQYLLDYYRSRRALVRAFVSAWHLADDLDDASIRRWVDQTGWYIDIADNSISRAIAE